MQPVAAAPSASSPAVHQPEGGQGPVGQPVLVHYGVTGRHHPVHHDGPPPGQRGERPPAHPHIDPSDPGQMAWSAVRHQQALSRPGVAGVRRPQRPGGRGRPLWAVPLGHEDEVGGGEGDPGAGVGPQRDEQSEGGHVPVQEGQDFAEDQTPVAARGGQDPLPGPKLADGLLSAALQHHRGVAGETAARLGRHRVVWGRTETERRDMKTRPISYQPQLAKSTFY